MYHAVDLPADATIRRILIIKWSAMGDVILATALFEDIARAFPGREIHLDTQPAWRDLLFADDPRFQRILAVDWSRRKNRLRQVFAWLRQVRSADYDLIIDLQCNDRSRFLLTLLRLSGHRARYVLGNRRQMPYDIAPAEPALPAHAVTRNRAALAAGGIQGLTPRPVLHVSARHRAHAQDLMIKHGLAPGNFGVFLPGCNAAGHLKRWGATRYAALADQLHLGGVARIVLIGGPDEIDECRQIAQLCGPWLINLCGETEILDVPPICESARFIVGNDTGTAHLAAMATTPMTIICGPTDPRRVKPLGDNVTTLQADLPCRNCYRKTCSHHSCMEVLTPTHVLHHVQKAID